MFAALDINVKPGHGFGIFEIGKVLVESRQMCNNKPGVQEPRYGQYLTFSEDIPTYILKLTLNMTPMHPRLHRS